MSHPLENHHLPGIGPMRQARLVDAGISSLEELLSRPIDELAALPGLNRHVIERARSSAQILLTAPPPPPLPELPDLPGMSSPIVPSDAVPQEPKTERIPVEPAQVLPKSPPKRLRRGMTAARRIETTLDGVRRCRAHCKPHPLLPPLRKDLKKLRALLERVQRESITHGLSKRAFVDLEALLAKLEARLDRFTAANVKPKRATKLLEHTIQMRTKLKARLS